MNKKFGVYIICGFITLILLIVFACGFGAANVSFIDSFKILLSKIPVIGNEISLEGINPVYIKIIFGLRLPRIILALLTGAALAIVGSAFQGVFKNPMADPFVLGISSGAAFGATIAIVLKLNQSFLGFGALGICAFAFAMLTVFIVIRIGAIGKNLPTVTLLLSGIAINYLLTSIISLMMIFNKDQLEKVYFWTLGSFNTATWNEIAVILPIVIAGAAVIMFFANDLNVMLMGDETAKSLGINVNQSKKIILTVSSLMVSVVVASSGIIGFVGLIIPHMIRIMNGPDHKQLIPLSMFAGGIFMIICDTIARSIIPPTEISVGIITSLFGVPFFLSLLYKNKKSAVG